MTEPSIAFASGITVYDLKNNTVSRLSDGDAFKYPVVLCLGNFDGVHIGHRALIDRTLKIAEDMKPSCPEILSGAWFFSRSTKAYLSGNAHAELTPLDEKLELLRTLGVELAFVADFETLKDLSPEEFVYRILKELCNCRFAVCGYDFRFGKQALGDAAALCSYLSGSCDIVDCVRCGTLPASSSSIREYLYEGDVEAAAKMLGRPYSLTSSVVHGKQLGRTLGFPTANLVFPEDKLIPKYGVYATLVKLKDSEKTYIGVSNIGKNPTVNDKGKGDVTCETYILDFSGDIYGKEISVEFRKMLRPERKFPSLEELTSAISHNADQARALLSDNV